MQFNDSVPTPLSSFTTPPSSGSEAPKHSKKKPKKKVNKEKNKRKKAEFKCAELKYKRKADKKLAAERQRSYELSCKLKFQRQLIHKPHRVEEARATVNSRLRSKEEFPQG